MILHVDLVPGRFASLVAGQPDRPIVKTAIPGPRTEELKAHLSSIQVSFHVISQLHISRFPISV